jgi:hypothetical protein
VFFADRIAFCTRGSAGFDHRERELDGFVSRQSRLRLPRRALKAFEPAAELAFFDRHAASIAVASNRRENKHLEGGDRLLEII